MPAQCNVVVLISGSGSNLQALIDSIAHDGNPARISAVISNRADAYGLERAKQAGIATAVLDHKQFDSREAFDAELAKVIDGYQPDLVVLAGFMRILTEGFVRHYEGRLLNIHPSLLPAFPGLHTHERAIEAGCKLAGATVHLVTPELDHGPIVIQAAVPVLPGDTGDTLSARVLKQEHLIYPRAVRWFVEGELTVAEGRVTHRSAQAQVVWAAE